MRNKILAILTLCLTLFVASCDKQRQADENIDTDEPVSVEIVLEETPTEEQISSAPPIIETTEINFETEMVSDEIDKPIFEEKINNNADKWIKSESWRDEDPEFCYYIPYSVIDLFSPLIEELKELGVSEIDNRIMTEHCSVFHRDGNMGFITKSYRHVQADATVYEVYIGRERISQRQEMHFGNTLCDGEYLYYVIDQDLIRMDKNGEITTYPIPYEDERQLWHHRLEVSGDEITIIPYWKEDMIIVINLEDL